jgi:hypothetical protein
MHRRLFCAAAASALACGLVGQVLNQASAASDHRISGPFVHDNLAIYLVHGKSENGPVPLTLQEAMAKNAVRVHETGNVNQLDIENLGDEEVFVQSGDIVKGGKQDRVLMVSLMLPSRSGKIAIASFCVEQGRWSARGKEDVKTFASAATALPSRKAKLAVRAPEPAPAPAPAAPGARTPGVRSLGLAAAPSKQQEVWDNVASIQSKLTDRLGAPVAAPESRSSLQLALENEKLKDKQAAYVSALQAAGEKEDDVVGYVFAINGKLNSAEIYPSNGLFRKMWLKLLNANATEAIGEKSGDGGALPPVEAVTAFLEAAERGDRSEKELPKSLRLETRDSTAALYSVTTRPTGGFVHRSYVAK